MSKVAIQGNASGTGTFTLAAPNSSTDRTLTLPDEAGTVLTGASDIEAQVKTATNATGSAPIYACRAWVNFNGTGTVAIRDSGNVSSITDNGTGDYTVNFTTAMPDADYYANANSCNEGNARAGSTVVFVNMVTGATVAPTTTAFRVGHLNTSINNAVDVEFVTALVVR